MAWLTLLAGLVWPFSAWAELPAVPVPAENPVAEAKRLLGKVLFWDEQLSSNDTVACGSCHLPGSGGSDPRVGLHPGADAGTIDDVAGSPGIVSLDEAGNPAEHPVFGFAPQVTKRASPSNFGALWAREVFWDGRAGGRVVDPLGGATVVAAGGALENQVLETLMNGAEMAKSGRTWDDLTAKLAKVTPLALASDLPADVREGLEANPSYPALFESAFGDPDITPVRIAFAIATYQRTLVADQTPWDAYVAGDETAMTAAEVQGWQNFERFHCTACHVPPLFTNDDFLNIGLRRSEYDRGRQAVTGAAEDAGDVRVPSLRNVGLRPRFMHTGEFATLEAAVRFYNNTPPMHERDDIPGIGNYSFSLDIITRQSIRVFLERALTDPRVDGEAFPFDRPTLSTGPNFRTDAAAIGRPAE